MPRCTGLARVNGSHCPRGSHAAADAIRAGAAASQEKAILLELIWMALLRAERHVASDVCASCLPLAASLPKPSDAVGASCTADYFTGTLREPPAHT